MVFFARAAAAPPVKSAPTPSPGIILLVLVRCSLGKLEWRFRSRPCTPFCCYCREIQDFRYFKVDYRCCVLNCSRAVPLLNYSQYAIRKSYGEVFFSTEPHPNPMVCRAVESSLPRGHKHYLVSITGVHRVEDCLMRQTYPPMECALYL